MAYVSQDDKKAIAAKINPILKAFGLKGTLSINHHSKLVLTIRSGKIDFIGNCNETNAHKEYFNPVKENMEINEFWYKEHFTGIALEALNNIVPAMFTSDWYDNSDIMSDYFDTKYYISVKVGTWDKPYQLVA